MCCSSISRSARSTSACLRGAFTGAEQSTNGVGARTTIDGPLGALAKVTGTVLSPTRPADISFPDGDTSWSLRIVPREPDGTSEKEAAVHARGVSKTFPNDPLLTGEQAEHATDRTALELRGTALHAELQIQDAARAQTTEALSVRVPALPGGYLEVRARSGMRGTFAYRHAGNAHARPGHAASSARAGDEA